MNRTESIAKLTRVATQLRDGDEFSGRVRL
jgi:hypothetical protein